MTAAGLGLNKFCYAGLIAAHKNKTPPVNDTAAKVSINLLFIFVLDSDFGVSVISEFYLFIYF